MNYTVINQVDNYALIKVEWDGKFWFRLIALEEEKFMELPDNPKEFLQTLIEVITYEEDEAAEESDS
jgi:hypothetical protein